MTQQTKEGWPAAGDGASETIDLAALVLNWVAGIIGHDAHGHEHVALVLLHLSPPITIGIVYYTRGNLVASTERVRPLRHCDLSLLRKKNCWPVCLVFPPKWRVSTRM